MDNEAPKYKKEQAGRRARTIGGCGGAIASGTARRRRVYMWGAVLRLALAHRERFQAAGLDLMDGYVGGYFFDNEGKFSQCG